MGVEEVAGGFEDAVAGGEDVLHGFAAEVEEAEFEAEVFVEGGGVEWEGEDVGGVEDFECVGDDFDFAGGEFWVFGALEAWGDCAGDADDVFWAEVVGCGGGVGEFFWAEDDLGDAVLVAEVGEDDAAVVASGVHPAGKGDREAGVGFAEFVAVMSAVGHFWFREVDGV